MFHLQKLSATVKIPCSVGKKETQKKAGGARFGAAAGGLGE
jgi:hypothetical protein